MKTALVSESHDNYRHPEDFKDEQAYIFNYFDKESIEKYKKYLFKEYEAELLEDRNRSMYKEQFDTKKQSKFDQQSQEIKDWTRAGKTSIKCNKI